MTYFYQNDSSIGYHSRGSKKQAGTGPSRRHIQGSKIAKRLPSVKYALLQYSKIEVFSKKNGPSGALKSHNAEKLKGGPFGGKNPEKDSQCRKKTGTGTLWSPRV